MASGYQSLTTDDHGDGATGGGGLLPSPHGLWTAERPSRVEAHRCKRSLHVSVRAAVTILLATATIAFVVCMMVLSSERGSAHLPSLPGLFNAPAVRKDGPEDKSVCDALNFSKRTLKLAKKEPFAALLARTGGTGHRYEASDIVKYGEYFYVVFDNLFALGRVHMNLPFNSENNWLIPQLVNGTTLLVDPANDPTIISADPTGASAKDRDHIIKKSDLDDNKDKTHPATLTAAATPTEFDAALNAITQLRMIPHARVDADGESLSDEELDVELARVRAQVASLPVPPPPLMNLEAPAAKSRIGDSGYEAIAHDKIDDRWYVVQEALVTNDGKIRSSIDDLKFAKDMKSYTLERSCFTEFEFTHLVRGFEGAFSARRDGEFFLVALCEGNFCEGGKKGREVGNGRLVVMKLYEDKDGCVWRTHRVVHLPPSASLIDYSAVTTYRDTEDRHDLRLVISSQESAQIWVGRIDLHKWEVYDYAKPRLYNMPRNDACEVIFCNIEGVHVLEDGMLAVVSDKMKSKGRQPARCLQQDQSLSIFVVPD